MSECVFVNVYLYTAHITYRRGLNRIINAKAHKKFIVHVTWAR